jgi:hypothetical protein
VDDFVAMDLAPSLEKKLIDLEKVLVLMIDIQ